MARTVFAFIGLFAAVFLLSVVQTAFLPYFAIANVIPDLLFTAFFIIIFFEERHSYSQGFFATMVCGFFLDLLLPTYFGISITALLAVYLLEKATVYFVREGRSQNMLYQFMALFAVYFVVYRAIIYGVSLWQQFSYQFDWRVLFAILYSLPFAYFGFFLYRKLIKRERPDNQLKLL